MPAAGLLGKTVRHLPNCVALTWPACNAGRDRYLKISRWVTSTASAVRRLRGRLLGESTAQKNAGHENDLMSRTLRLCQWMDPAAYRVLVSPWMATRTLSRRRSSALLVVD